MKKLDGFVLSVAELFVFIRDIAIVAGEGMPAEKKNPITIYNPIT